MRRSEARDEGSCPQYGALRLCEKQGAVRLVGSGRQLFLGFRCGGSYPFHSAGRGADYAFGGMVYFEYNCEMSDIPVMQKEIDHAAAAILAKIPGKCR